MKGAKSGWAKQGPVESRFIKTQAFLKYFVLIFLKSIYDIQKYSEFGMISKIDLRFKTFLNEFI